MSITVARGERAMGGRTRRLAGAEYMPLVVGALTLAVFLLRLSQMHQSLFGDEVWTYQDISGHSLGTVLRTVHTGAENSPPLFFVLAWLSAKLGDPTIWIRLPSLLLGTATIPLIYVLGRETVGRLPGVIGAAIVAASPFSLYYGIEARPYATMAFFVTLSTFALLRAVRTGSRSWWLLYAIAAAGAAYTHYTSIFVLAVQALWSLWACRERIREPLIANAFVLLLYLPWLGHIRGKSLAVIAALEPLTFHNVLIDLARPIPGYPYASLRTIPTILGLGVIAACVGIGLVTILRRTNVRSWGRELPPHLPLLVALTVATPIGLLLYSLLATDLWLARGLYASVPAAALILGAVLAAPPLRVRAVLVAAVLATLLFGSIRAISPAYARPPFRSVAQYLDRVATPRDPIIMYASLFDIAIPEMFHRPHTLENASARVWQSLGGHSTVYVVVEDGIARAFKLGPPHLRGFGLVARKHWGGLTPVTLLTYRALGSARTR